MVELATIELTGKLLRLPYWSVPQHRPRSIRRCSARWRTGSCRCRAAPELTRFFQEQLRFRKFYDGPADGKPNAAYTRVRWRPTAQAVGDGQRAASPTSRCCAGLPAAADSRSRRHSRSPPRRRRRTAGAGRRRPQAGARRSSCRVKRRQDPLPQGRADRADGHARRGSRRVYCYVQSPTTGKIQRIFPNRFARDPRARGQHAAAAAGRAGFQGGRGRRGRQAASGGLPGNRARGLTTICCRRRCAGATSNTSRHFGTFDDIQRRLSPWRQSAAQRRRRGRTLIDVSDK